MKGAYDLINLEQAIIVEGKYDKIKLSSIIESVIIPTNGFSIFKDKEKCALIRFYAENKGIIIITDSDTAGFKIRNYIKGFVKKGSIKNVYVPDILGKEKRKLKPSKEGKLGVEGISKEILLGSFKKAGVLVEETEKKKDLITRLDLYEDGFSGSKNSSIKRKMLLEKLELPELLTTSSMLEVLNSMFCKDEYKKLVAEIKLPEKMESE